MTVSSFIAGELVTETFDYDGGRRVTVYVPPVAPEAVVFAGDGQLISQWGGVLEATDVPPTMIVGTHRLDDDMLRLHEYSPVFDAERFAAHEKFFVEDVRRWIRSRFAVALPAERTAVFGVSASGELALAMALRHPDIYGAVFCASPGGGYRPPAVLPNSLPRAYLVAGTLEPFFLQNATRWAVALRDAGADVVMSERDGSHGDAFWKEEFPLMVAWAFGGASLTTRGPVLSPDSHSARSATTETSLATHLQERYSIEVAAVAALDAAVFRVDRRDGPSWVARVFPVDRPIADVQDETELLRALEESGFPAERCAHDEPVSGFGGQAVLVTEFVAPAAPLKPGRTAALLGGMLGALHSRPATRFRSGGAWHHLSFNGGPRVEIAAAGALLDDAIGEVPARQLAMFDRLREAVDRADDCEDLPHVLVHPDFVSANAIPTPDERLVLVDWTGAGRGPRLWSLGFLLWAAGAVHPRLIELAVSRYRKRTSLEPEEFARLEGAIVGRPLMIECWSFCHGRRSLADTVQRMDANLELANKIAAQARQAFTAA
ncbi:MAG: phosphotransferase [Solirubrobacterales bacterium]|nr:phosphotransferase [Solirubrobacterales bacterium]